MNDQLTHTQKIKLGEKHARAVPMKSPALGEQHWNGEQGESDTTENQIPLWKVYAFVIVFGVLAIVCAVRIIEYVVLGV